MRLLLLFALFVGTVSAVAAQCGPNGCRVPAATPAESKPTWHHFPDTDPARLYLFRGNIQLGAYDLEARYFRTFEADHDAWGPPQPETPIPLPAVYQTRNYGVDRTKISSAERVTCNGRPIAKSAALEMIQGPTIPDDAGFIRLTIIGPDELRQRVRADLASHPELTRLGTRLVVQDYPVDHWAVARAGFFTGGQPTIYLQTPDGKVLHRQDRYDGPDELATAIRRADPSYNKDLDPNLLKPSPLRPESWPAYVWLLLGGAVLFLTSRKERS